MHCSLLEEDFSWNLSQCYSGVSSLHCSSRMCSMAEGVVSLPIWLRTPPCDNQPCTKGPLRPMMDTTSRRRRRMKMWMTMRMEDNTRRKTTRSCYGWHWGWWRTQPGKGLRWRRLRCSRGPLGEWGVDEAVKVYELHYLMYIVQWSDAMWCVM